MKVDAYTKFILTVIAVCLFINVVGDIEILSSANAQMRGSYVAHDVQKVSICNPGGNKCGDDWIQYVREK